jgi:branched-chain amino acid transport system permease protein
MQILQSLRSSGLLIVLAIALVADYFYLGTAQFVNALTIGGIYALIALGYTMVYGIIELINFAHGDVFMVGSMVTMFMLTQLGFTGAIDNFPELVVMLILTFLVAMIVVGILGVIIERLAYRPLRNAPKLAPLITAIGVSFILENIVQVLVGPSPVSIPQLINPLVEVNLAGTQVSVLKLFVVAITFVLMIALRLFINRTRMGRAMRSTAIDRDAASLMGVDINQTIAVTFFIGSALAGAAGVVQGLYFGTSNFVIGFQAGLKAFTAAVLGGIGNTTGAALGGFMIGFIEVNTTVFQQSRWAEAVVFTILVLVLVFRPTGLLGQQLGDRA